MWTWVLADPSIERCDVRNRPSLSDRADIQPPHEDIAVPNFVLVIGNHDSSDRDDAKTWHVRELAFGNALVPFFTTDGCFRNEMSVQPMFDAVASHHNASTIEFACWQ